MDRDHDQEAVRVFFALVPPLPLRQTLGDLARAVARHAHGRPVPAENIHLTLAFVGTWPAGRLDVLFEVGGRLDAAPLAIVLDTLGGFRRAGVAWIGTSAAPPALAVLAASLGALLREVGIAVDERPLHPHLTLARKCHRYPASERVGPLRWIVDDVTLMQSDTRAEGAHYRQLARWALRPR